MSVLVEAVVSHGVIPGELQSVLEGGNVGLVQRVGQQIDGVVVNRPFLCQGHRDVVSNTSWAVA